MTISRATRDGDCFSLEVLTSDQGFATGAIGFFAMLAKDQVQVVPSMRRQKGPAPAFSTVASQKKVEVKCWLAVKPPATNNSGPVR